MHKTIIGATHIFRWWGVGGYHGPGELENAWGMREYGLIAYVPFGAGRSPRCILLPSNGAAAHFPILLLIGRLLTGDVVNGGDDGRPSVVARLHPSVYRGTGSFKLNGRWMRMKGRRW